MRKPSTAGPAWRKATYSASNSNCVELGALSGSIACQDSKDPHGPYIRLTTRTWTEFISGIKAGVLPG
ncbi:DUF397 domain-containing protein [Streptomyces sp. UNOC14_S4]|nr:DUF397 domain-containing protein [Streptomyces sp. UNOC14_S4]